MNNKKVVRLTESQLHNIIAESVSQILMELDPRTYASAADKAEERMDIERASKFRQGAVDAWNRDFGDFYDDDYINSKFYMNNEDDVVYKPRSSHKDKMFGSRTYDVYDPSKPEKYQDTINRFSKRNPKFQKRAKALDVAKQMTLGNGKYIDGQGWQ